MVELILIMTILGMSIGSFLNVVIYRTPNNKAITGRSHCTTCDRQLTWLELIPVFSYVAQKGKCRGCGDKISPRYAIVELMTGLLYALFTYAVLVNRHPLYYLPLGAIVISMLITLSFIDFDTMHIPNWTTFTIVVVALILSTLNGIIKINMVAAIVLYVILFILALATGGLGLGDVKLMFASGLLVGLEGSLAAMIIGGVVAIIIEAIVKKVDKGKPFPFGPYLALGIYVAWLLKIYNII